MSYFGSIASSSPDTPDAIGLAVTQAVFKWAFRKINLANTHETIYLNLK